MMVGVPSPPAAPCHRRTGSGRRILTSTATPRTAPTTATTFPSSPSYNSNAQTHYGLLITLEQERLCLRFCPDRNVREIHPNAYAPASLRGVKKLGGGGSGVAVFGGHHEELGPVVMKHGSDKDMVELFALCTVAQELKHRSKAHPDAARHISQRIPAFRMIYISPHHLGEKRKALWNRLRNIRRINDTINPFLLPTNLLSYDEDDSQTSSSQHSPTSWRSYEEQFGDDDCHTAEDEVVEAEESFRMLKNRSVLAQYRLAHAPENLPPGVEMSKSGTFSGHRDIAIVTGPPQQHVQVKLRGESLVLVVPHVDNDDKEAYSHTRKICVPGDGYQHLKSIVQDLLSLMGENLWKFTLGQKLIGGENPQTGNEWLYSNNLLGPVLDNLVTQKINLVQDLVKLTTLEEQDPKVLESIREEVQKARLFHRDANAENLSPQADAFVGNAIRKNFRSETGRIAMMMLLGKHFRDCNIKPENIRPIRPSFLRSLSGNHKKNPKQLDNSCCLILTPEEQIPAYHLGMITIPGALLGRTFAKSPLEPTVLESMGPHSNYWQTLLSAAVAEKAAHQNNNNSMIWKRLWTCGLADAGLHNLFLSESRLWLFDLGEPQLTSVPGFLTKFLFSFFHTLGMQEPATDDSNTWVRRFDHNPKTCQLQLTSRTSQLLYLSYSAFERALDRIVNELFNGDDSVRWLLLQYVTLQLISDASFCLQRWTVKGGGRARDSNHQEGLEKWLWRALWDIYVACDINSTSSLHRLKVQSRKLQDSPNASRALRERSMSLIQELSLVATLVGE